MPEKTAIIFGDSIMKGTVYEGGRYRSCYTEVFLPQMEGLDIALDNRSRFGYTAERGLGLIKKAIAAGIRTTPISPSQPLPILKPPCGNA